MSKCKYCRKPVIWIAKPNGRGWFPPFNEPTELTSMTYQLLWSETGDWVAIPENQDQQIEMTTHTCEEYDNFMDQRLMVPQSLPAVDLDEADFIVEERERVVYKDIPNSRIEKLAYKMRTSCSVCGAMPFKWCTYINGDRKGEETSTLHRPRGL